MEWAPFPGDGKGVALGGKQGSGGRQSACVVAWTSVVRAEGSGVMSQDCSNVSGTRGSRKARSVGEF